MNVYYLQVSQRESSKNAPDVNGNKEWVCRSFTHLLYVQNMSQPFHAESEHILSNPSGRELIHALTYIDSLHPHDDSLYPSFTDKSEAHTANGILLTSHTQKVGWLIFESLSVWIDLSHWPLLTLCSSIYKKSW